MSSEGQKSMGLKVLGSCGILISIISLATLLFMYRTHPEYFTVRLNILFVSYISLLFISSWGIILHKAWARTLLIIISSIKIIEGVIKSINYIINDLPQMRFIHLLGQSVTIIIFSSIIYFLCRKSIRNQFREHY